MNNRGRTVLEAVVVLIVVGILLVGAITYYQRATRVVKEYAMISELSNIRTSILLYFVINRKFPESLKQMVEEKIILPFWDKEALKEVAGIGKEISLQSGSIVIDRTYLEKMSIDSDGNILDPFGKPYLYDQKLKRVKSSTAGYEAF